MTHTSSNSSPAYFPALTGVRALAALLVYFHHFNPIPKEYIKLHGFFDEMHVGVTFFFVLSGFLITLRYSDKKTNFRQYFINRFARIYPMWFILTLITFLTFYNFSYHWFSVLFANLTLIKGFSDTLKFTGIDQGWSLTVEECFYFLAPLLILLLSKNLWRIITLTLGFVAAGIVLHFICTVLHIPAFQNFRFIFLYTIFGRPWEFLIGVTAAFLYKSKKEKIEYFFKKIPGVNALLLLCIAVCIYFLNYFKPPEKYGYDSIEGLIINNFILPNFIILFYLGLISKKDFFSTVLSGKALMLGGKISYIFYLIHMGIFHVYLSSCFDYIGILKFRKPIEFAALAALSTLLYYFMEEPLNKAVKRFFGKKEIN